MKPYETRLYINQLLMGRNAKVKFINLVYLELALFQGLSGLQCLKTMTNS